MIVQVECLCLCLPCVVHTYVHTYLKLVQMSNVTRTMLELIHTLIVKLYNMYCMYSCMLFEGGGCTCLYSYVCTYCSMCNNLLCYICTYNYNVDLLSDATPLPSWWMHPRAS